MGGQPGRRLHRRRILTGAAGIVGAQALAGCGLFARPAPEQPPATPTSTPTPTRVPTVTPAPVAPPPPPAATFTTVAPQPLPTPVEASALRGSGQLLYAGRFDGVRGAILATDGTPRLLVPGAFTHLAWSPDGARFAGIIGATANVPIQQIVIATADGAVQARYPAPEEARAIENPAWSPDGRTLLYHARERDTNGSVAWVVDDAGQRAAPFNPEAVPWRWTPRGRVAHIFVEGGRRPQTPYTSIALFGLDLTNGLPYREIAGPFYPLDWSADGATLYALGGLRAVALAGGGEGLLPTTLLAIPIDRPEDRRVLIDVGATGGPGGWLQTAAVAPGDGLLAIARASLTTTPGGTPTTLANAVTEVIVLNGAGWEVARDSHWQLAASAVRLAWSPDGRRLAFIAPGASGVELRVLDLDRPGRIAFPIRPDPRGPAQYEWSPNSRWLAYVDAEGGGLTLTTPGAPRGYRLAPDGSAPVWRPARVGSRQASSQ